MGLFFSYVVLMPKKRQALVELRTRPAPVTQ